MSPPNSPVYNLELGRWFLIYGVMTQVSLQSPLASWSILRECDEGWSGRVGEGRSKVYHPRTCGLATLLLSLRGSLLPRSVFLVHFVHL